MVRKEFPVRTKEIALEGIDGCGKSTIANELKSQLETEGLCVYVDSPYKRANVGLGHDVYGMWPKYDSAKAAINAIRQATEAIRTDAANANADVTIFDRHWMTAFTEIGERSELVEYWGNTFVPTVLLIAAPLTATRRLTNGFDTPWSKVSKQADYDLRFRELARQHPENMLGMYRTDTDLKSEAIAHQINWDMHILR